MVKEVGYGAGDLGGNLFFTITPLGSASLAWLFILATIT